MIGDASRRTDATTRAPDPTSAGTEPTGLEILELDLERYRRAIPNLVELTLDAVAAGASINVAGSAAEALYRSLGWHETGTVLDYALNADGVPEAATFFWKDLG